MAKTTARRTSISETAASKFIANAKPREMLGCKKIAGFHLLKLTKGCSWRYRYTDATGKRRVVTIGGYPAMLPEEAAKRVGQWLSDEADPLQDRHNKRQTAISAEEARKQKTLQAYLDGRYEKIMQTWPTGPAKINRQRLTLHFSALLEKPMDEITETDIKTWQASMEDKGRAFTTIKRTYGALKALLRQAVQDKVISADPLAGFKLDSPTYTEQQRIKDDPKKDDRRMLSSDEITALHTGLEAMAEEIREQRRSSRKHGKPHLPDLDAVAYPHWFIPFCHLAFHTGLRPSDLYTITWSDELNVNFGTLKKKTSKSSRAIRSGGKATEVVMKLNDRILAVMRQWWEQQGKPKTGLVFPSPVTGRELDGKAHTKPWKRVKKLGGLDEGLDFYALRHNFISILVAQGLPLLTVAKLSGHKSATMIEGHYGHLCPNQAAQAVDILSKAVDFSQGKENKA